MKSLKKLRTVPGAALALAIMAISSVGVYALSNWFGGNVIVKQTDPSVFSVDLSSCKGSLPGVDSKDRSNVQFKIMGSSHISAADLQSELLAQCELDAVWDFYNGQHYSLTSSTVKAVSANSVTLSYNWGSQMHEKTFATLADIKVYNQGQPIALRDLRSGDKVVLATNPPANWLESDDPLTLVSEVQSIFKTEHDTMQAPGSSKKGFYEQYNIMPLDMYNNLNK